MKKMIGVLVIVCTIFVYSSMEEYESYESIEELSMENLEALASGEGGGFVRCRGNGSLDCNGIKVSWISPYSLNDEE